MARWLDAEEVSAGLRVDLAEELQKATALTHDGRVVHPAFATVAEPAVAPELDRPAPISLAEDADAASAVEAGSDQPAPEGRA